MTEFVIDRHLGGYIKDGDPATFYPELWRWLVEDYGVRSVVDVGCGEGHALQFFRDLDCKVKGIDGIQQDDPSIFRWDYSRLEWPHYGDLSNNPPGGWKFDLAWCCEFVEHVEERYIPNFLATFQCADLVLMTHAFPGQPGHHHVNLQEPNYWKGVMAAIGYEHDDVLTAATRELASENKSPWNHFLRSGMAFRRYS